MIYFNIKAFNIKLKHYKCDEKFNKMAWKIEHSTRLYKKIAQLYCVAKAISINLLFGALYMTMNCTL